MGSPLWSQLLSYTNTLCIPLAFLVGQDGSASAGSSLAQASLFDGP